MKTIFLKIYYKIASFFMNLNTAEVPLLSEDYYENHLLQKIEPVINNEKMSDTEKIEILKKMIENYDPLEY